MALLVRYILDTCCYMSIDGKHQRPSIQCTEIQRDNIWNGLERLGSERRVLLTSHVLKEIKYLYPPPVPQQIQAIPIIKTGMSIPVLRETVRAILRNHPSLIRHNGSHTRDPADPWIIAAAKHNECTVVTDELPRLLRSRRKTLDYIPEVCEALGIECITLSTFISREKLD
jgi:hypothetical protein